MADNPSEFSKPAQTVEEPEELKPETTPDFSGYVPPPVDSTIPSSASGGIGGIIRIVILVLLAILIVGGVVLVISRFLKGGKQAGPVVLTYWGLWEPEEVIKPLIDDFQRTNPNVTVQYVFNSPTQYRERLQAAVERGEGPDVFRFHNTWLPMYKSILAPVPSSIISEEELTSTFYPMVSRDLNYQNKLYGLPIMTEGLMLFYNKDLFAGIGAVPPKTWDEFEDRAYRLTVKDASGKISQAGAAIGTADNITHFSDIIGLIFLQNGVEFPTVTSQNAVQALTYYCLFAQKPNNVWDAEQDNSIYAFASGKIGMIFAPSWEVMTIQSLNPNLNFGTTPVPKLTGATEVAWGSYWSEGVSARSPHQEEAFEFVKFMTQKESETKLFSEAVKTGRAFGEAYSRKDLSSELAGNELLKPLASDSPVMQSWYMASNTFDNGINDKIIKYFKDAVNAVYMGASPDGVLGTVQNGINQVFSDYGVQ
jgi:multiple sugar transport system substrate-binding protein